MTASEHRLRLAEVEALPALDLVRSPGRARTVARALAIGLFLFAAILLVVPWQQNISGSGKVVALTPQERQQTLDAPVEGRITRWFVIEGTRVQAGDPIAQISDNDPNIIERLTEERRAIVERLDAARRRAGNLEERITGLQGSRQSAIDAAQGRVQMAVERVRAAEQSLLATEARLTTARLNNDRQKRLADKGLTSTRNVELAELEYQSSVAEVDRAKATLAAAKTERGALDSDLQRTINDFKASIEDARASLASAQVEIANSNAALQQAEVRVARQNTQNIVAPRDGTILRLIAQPGSELMKSGDPIAVFVPEATTPVVELNLAGNDVPLIHKGDPVRLQFEGWPAIQFSGWPSVAVGTFGGKVLLVDATDNGQGKFRILVVPDDKDKPWPSARYLRQGVRTNGWVLLRQVPLGFELWRIFNGFPPVIAQDEPGAGGGKKK